MRPFAAAMVIWTVLAASPAVGDVIERRGNEPRLDGQIERVDDAGVQIRSKLGAMIMVPWDRVREARADKLQREIDQRMPMAVDLWRARSRVERGDTELAEPMLERLFARLEGQTHETALAAAEGLLRCRLARGDHVQAVIPALESARLRKSPGSAAWLCYRQLELAIDPATSLCPMLPPVWPATPGLRRLEDELSRYDPKGDEVVAALARLYRRAVVQTLGAAWTDESGAAAKSKLRHDGVELLGQLVVAASTELPQRREAMDQLAHRMASLSPWAEAWARYQLGMAQLLERDDADRRQAGVLNLLHLPARFARTQPYLAGLSLRRAAEVLEQEGMREAAVSLREELAEYDAPSGSLTSPPAPTPPARQETP